MIRKIECDQDLRRRIPTSHMCLSMKAALRVVNSEAEFEGKSPTSRAAALSLSDNVGGAYESYASIISTPRGTRKVELDPSGVPLMTLPVAGVGGIPMRRCASTESVDLDLDVSEIADDNIDNTTGSTPGLERYLNDNSPPSRAQVPDEGHMLLPTCKEPKHETKRY